MADLVLISGPPGAGKTTVAAIVADTFPSVSLVPGDAFFAFWVKGAVPPWLPEAHAQNAVVLRAAAAAAGALVAGGCDVVYDGVVGPWHLRVFVEAARLEMLHYAVLLPPLEQCVERVATRHGHGFTDPVATRRMHDEFRAADIAERHVLRAVGAPQAAAEWILAGVRDGALAYRA